MVKIINGITWYDVIISRPNVDGLLSFAKDNELLIALSINKKFVFGSFENIEKFAEYSYNIKDEYKCFYEIILGDTPQKPHFDIDIDKKFCEYNHELIKDLVIEECINELKIDINNFLVFSSHGEHKYSYHIIINNYIHKNNKEAKAFAYFIINKLPIQYQMYVDKSVYKSKQQFRIVRSQKVNSGRPKILLYKWKFFDKEIFINKNTENDFENYIFELNGSLISNWNKNDIYIRPYVIEINNNIPISNITEEIGKLAYSLLIEVSGVTEDHPNFPYRYVKCINNIIIIKRIRPSRCRLCDRIHEAENPFLKVINNNVYFCCRRNDNMYHLGEIIYEKHIPSDITKEHIPSDITKEHIPSDITKEHIPSDIKKEDNTSDITKEDNTSDITKEEEEESELYKKINENRMRIAKCKMEIPRKKSKRKFREKYIRN
jgi:hypothetical protein